jgi:ATP-dependent DNA ligase
VDEQPRLPLVDGAAGVPGWLDAEAATPCGGPFDSDDWLFSIDWDGSRCLLVTDDSGAVRMQGLNRLITDRYPEIVEVAARSVPPGSVLDGVVCMLDAAGRPDLPALGLRMAGAGRGAAVFLAADLLRADGASLVEHPLEDRLERLAALIPGDPHLQMPESVPGRGVALAEAAAEHGLTAVLARARQARYRPGVASPDRLRVELSGRRDRVVAGRWGAESAVRLVLCEFSDGRLRYTETVRLTGPPAVLRWLDDVGEPVGEPPCEGADHVDRSVRWLQPRLTATIATASPPSRSAALVVVRDDLDPRWCVLRAPVAPPAAFSAHPSRVFTPTVLHALPLDAA